MARKRYSEEDILRLLREIELHLHGGDGCFECLPHFGYFGLDLLRMA